MGSLKNEEELEQIGEESKEAILYVNGIRKVLPDGLAHFTLLEYLRGLILIVSIFFSVFFYLKFIKLELQLVLPSLFVWLLRKYGKRQF